MIKAQSDGDGGFYRWSRPKAMKKYNCNDCGGIIPKGNKHSNLSGINGIFDFNYISLRWCNNCQFENNNINPENDQIERAQPNAVK